MKAQNGSQPRALSKLCFRSRMSLPLSAETEARSYRMPVAHTGPFRVRTGYLLGRRGSCDVR